MKNDSPRYGELVDQYRGRLGAFHERHQQQVKISGNNQYAAKVSWPGARAIYHNNNGQETITMVVDGVEKGAEEKMEKPEDYYNWALVEFPIPIDASYDVDNVLAVFLKGNYKGQQVWANSSDINSDDDLLRFAYSQSNGDPSNVPFIGDIAQNATQLDSLLINLKPFHQPVSFDLYGFMFAYHEPDSETLVLGSVDAIVRCVLFDQDLMDAISVLRTPSPPVGGGTGEIFYQWESSKKYPARLKMGEAPVKLTYPGIQLADWPDGSVDNHFGGQKLGTLTISPIKSNPGFNLKPA